MARLQLVLAWLLCLTRHGYSLRGLSSDKMDAANSVASRVEGVAQEGISSNQLIIVMMELGPRVPQVLMYRIASVVSCDV